MAMATGNFDDRKALLTPLEYQVVVNKATERPFSNKYNRHFEDGTYHCIICNQELFQSQMKFQSKSGWPAFSNVVHTDRVKLRPDSSHVGMNLLLLASRPDLVRTEVSCAVCGAHLGHLFKDGPKPTGLRYCINSSSLNFQSSHLQSPLTDEIKGSPGCETPEKLCFFNSVIVRDRVEGCGNNKESTSSGGIVSTQRISTPPRPLPIHRETTL